MEIVLEGIIMSDLEIWLEKHSIELEEWELKELVDIINTQKRLYAESVIGEDDQITKNIKVNSPWLALDNRHRNELRAEQRARIK